jgi:hypothetical protein
MAFTGTSKGKLEPLTHEGKIIRYTRKLAEARNNNKPEMIALFERQLAELTSREKIKSK